MYPGDLCGEDGCAGAASDVNELCEGCVSRVRFVTRVYGHWIFLLSVVAVG